MRVNGGTGSDPDNGTTSFVRPEHNRKEGEETAPEGLGECRSLVAGGGIEPPSCGTTQYTTTPT